MEIVFFFNSAHHLEWINIRFLWPTRTLCVFARISILPCKAKRQYLLTFQVSRYCLLALQNSIHVHTYYIITCNHTWQSLLSKHPMLFQCWAIVEDDGPTLKQHDRVNDPCLLGSTLRTYYRNVFFFMKKATKARTLKLKRSDKKGFDDEQPVAAGHS